MADPTPRPIPAAAFWGTILASAQQHATTAQVWDALRAARDQLGVSFPSDIFSQVNALRANASRVIVASERLMAASGATAIDSSMIGRPIYARSLAQQEAMPQYEVRLQISVQSLEGTASRWATVYYGSDLPDTVGQLGDDVEAFAAGFANDYGGELASVDSFMLNAV